MSKNFINNTGAVILAAGKGTRLGCTDCPKVMLSVGGKPIVEYVVEKLENIGFAPEQICLVVGFHKETVKEYFGNRVIYADQHEQLGTGHAVSMVEPAFGNTFEHIIVFNGDMPFVREGSIWQMLEEHVVEKSTLTLATVTVPHFKNEFSIFSEFGRIVRDEQGRIVADVEAKDLSREHAAVLELNVGLYCFRAEWLWENLSRLGRDNAQGELYLTDLIKICIDENEPVVSVSLEISEALGINTPQDLKEANKKIIK